jgi:hypothetical protein
MVGELRQRDAQLGGEPAHARLAAVGQPIDDPQSQGVGQLAQQRGARIETVRHAHFRVA